MINLKINDKPYSFNKKLTILEACKNIGINIPHLCNLDIEGFCKIKPISICRLCIVNIDGTYKPSCSTYIENNQLIMTDSYLLQNMRKEILKLILSNHPNDCLQCRKNNQCKLQSLAKELLIEDIFYDGKKNTLPVEHSYGVTRDMSKCILCRKCYTVCAEMQNVHALNPINRGFSTTIATEFNKKLDNTKCIMCGQCIQVCPVGALTVRQDIEIVNYYLNNKDDYILIADTAPSVRVALGEEFMMNPGEINTGKMVASLKKIGFDYVFDTNFAADLTIIEEVKELKKRLNNLLNNKPTTLPLITSCCPGWVKYCEHNFHDFLPNLSSTKSPNQMFGSICKTYFKEKLNKDKKMIIVSIMPCTAKKFEIKREEFNVDSADIDFVLTTTELAKLIKYRGINFNKLDSMDFDKPIGFSSGAGMLFGKTGGVMEAALRTAIKELTGDELKDINYKIVDGNNYIKEANIKTPLIDLKIAVAHTLSAASIILNKIKNKETYHMIEIMACPYGCIGGGGQPNHYGDMNLIKKRLKSIKLIDQNSKIKRSDDNPDIKKLYNDYLNNKNIDVKKLLHTKYNKR